jgi:hypothetical protein
LHGGGVHKGKGVSVASASGVSVVSAGIISVCAGGRVRVGGNCVIEFSESDGEIEHAANRAVRTNRIMRTAKCLKILWAVEK